MDAIFAAWNAPLVMKPATSFQNLFDDFDAWADAVVMQQRKSSGGTGEYNVFQHGPLQVLMTSKSGSRPDIQRLCEMPKLCSWLLLWPEKVTWSHIRDCLQRAHVKQALRIPKLPDDNFWLTNSARGLHCMRAQLVFCKAYANRVQHRVTMLPPEYMATVASLLRGMDWTCMHLGWLRRRIQECR